VDPEIEAAVRTAADALRCAGAEVVEVDVAMTARDEAVWMDLWAVFMAGYYGHLLDEHGHHMDERVVSLIAHGTGLSAAHVKRLDVERTDLWRRVAPVLSDHDAILCPTMAVAPPVAEKSTWHSIPLPPGEDGRYHAPDMTAVWNLLSPCPALSVPCGWHADGLPIGLQIVGRRWREDTVLRIGRAVELALPEVAARRPPR
jgi:Asp-tRNA(Asn)/Glu-tRNA(Gln) amidotransferase A subunit family amidase